MRGRLFRLSPTSVARAAACLGLAGLVGVWAPAGGLSSLPGLHGSGAAAHAATPPWMDATQTPAARAAEVMAAMTLDDKLSMLHNTTSCAYAGCTPSSFSGGTLPALHLQDGPVGVGDGVGDVTLLPAPVDGAATWDTALMKQYGGVLGAEQWGKGVNVALAPTVNIVRDPRWGRAFESLGEDPYLSGQIAAADINGIQAAGPMAQVKHFAVYNQETNRNAPADNAIVSERAMQEIYLPQFAAAIKQGNAASVMCSYSSVNGPYACENGHLLNDILKGQMGFQGFVTSDWGATHSTVASANNGLDMEMPDSNLYFGTALKTAVTNGQVSQATIDDKVRRILTQMFAFGLFDKTQPGTKDSVVTSAAHTATALQVAEQGSVLLKNTASVLPLGTSTHSIAVIGDDAGGDAETQGGGSAAVNPDYTVTPFNGIKARAGAGATVSFYQGIQGSTGALPPVPSSVLTPSTGTGTGLSAQFFNGTTLAAPAILSRNDPNVDFNWAGASPGAGVPTTNWSAEWTGSITPPTTGTYTFSLTSDDGSRMYVNGNLVVNNWANQVSTTKTGTVALTAGQKATIEVDYYQSGSLSNATLGWQVPGQSLQDAAVAGAKSSDVAVVFVNKYESEGGDLSDIDLGAAQNNLVSAVAAANPNTVVVLNTGSAVTMPWIASVKGAIEAWYPGQEDGNAIAALLYGDVNPSGKLPVTFPNSLNDVPAHTAAQWPGTNNTVQYSEGIDVGYRWYDSQNITPLFPFGFGLSYTTFGYSGLSLSNPDSNGNVTASFTITNTGTRTGSEVAQVYVGEPTSSGEPPKDLQGFQKVSLAAGASTTASVVLPARAFQYYGASGWVTPSGAATVYIGSSSRDIRLTGTITPSGTPPPTTTPPTTTPPTTPPPTTPPAGNTSAYATIQAESYSAQSGTQAENTSDTGGGQDMAYISNGDYLQYNNVDFGSAPGTSFTARFASAVTTGGSIEVHLDSLTNPAVATLAVNSTGGWQTWASGTATLASTTGLHTVYLKFVSSGTGDFVNLNWFDFTQGTPSQQALPRTGWVVTASSSGGADVPANAVDGNATSRWSTGTPEVNGQWYDVDLGSVKTFDQVSIDVSASAGDYPRGLTVQGSNDNATWTTLGTAAPTTATTTVTFSAASDRYVRLLQTGTSSSWWSIDELNVLTGATNNPPPTTAPPTTAPPTTTPPSSPTALSRTGWLASANPTSGDVPANAIDGSLATRFSSGSAMVNGQWFQVDMGTAKAFDQVTMDSTNSASDYARGYTIEASNDASTWTVVATGTGTTAVITSRFAATTDRYVRVVQTGTANSWWSMAEFNVYAG